MKIRQLEFFVKVVETGSISAAARSLNVSQPSLGEQIRKLESELGSPLLEREARGVSLTEAGAMMLVHARSILERVEHAQAEIRALRSSGVTEVKIGAPPTPGKMLIPDLMIALQEQSNVRLLSQSGLSEDLAALVLAGKLDLALCYDIPGVESRGMALFDEDMFLVGGSAIVHRDAGPIEFRELTGYPLVLDARFRGARRHIDRAAQACGVTLDVSYDVESILLRQDIMHRDGKCTIVPFGTYMEMIEAGNFGARRIVEPSITRQLSLHCRSGLPSHVLDVVLEQLTAIITARTSDQRLWLRPIPRKDA